MSELALKLIAENKAKHARGEDARVLDLGNCGLTEVPEEVGECVWLEELILSDEWWDHTDNLPKYNQNGGQPNNCVRLPDSISNLQELKRLVAAGIYDSKWDVSDLSPLCGLKNLKELYCENTKISDLLPLERLTNLHLLVCSNTQIYDLSPLANLKKIKNLDCSDTQINNLEPISDIQNLSQFYFYRTKVFDLKCVKNLNLLNAINFSSTEVNDLRPLSGLKNLRHLSCWNTKISDLSPLSALRHLLMLNCSSTQTESLSPLSNLHRLESLDISYTKVSDLSPIVNLANLQVLDFSGTDIDALKPIAKLTKLREISFANTKVSEISALSGLKSLKMLNCAETHVSSLSSLVSLIENGIKVQLHGVPHVYYDFDIHVLDGIYVKSCPLIHPPPEIVKQGNSAILQYFEELERAKQTNSLIRLAEAKCLVLGEGSAGKTSLTRKLLDPNNPLPEEKGTTKGINVHPHDFKLPDGTDFRLNIWDFGGQEIYHATHQFFLTKRSLYLLLDDTRKDEKTVNDPTFNYWLQVAELYGGGSPLLIVQNEKGDRSKELDLRGMQGRFGFVKDAKAVNLLTCRGLEDVWGAIEYWLKQLPHVGEQQPKAWLDIRRELERLALEEKRDHISLEEYYRICAQFTIPERERALFLSGYLHDFGAFLHFQDDSLLRKTLVLNNQWATDAVYKVLDCEHVKRTFGRFTRRDLTTIWAGDRYVDQHEELLALMKKFELCYKLPDEKIETWLAPQLLSVLQPDALAWDENNNLQVRYEYEFMPKGLLSQHIVRMHRYVRQPELAWKSGGVFERAGAQALVREEWGSRKINLRARGVQAKELLTLLSEDFDKMHELLEGLKVKKMIPCNCRVCDKAVEPHFYEYEDLATRKANGKKTVECKMQPYEDVSVAGLLDDVFAKKSLDPRLLLESGKIEEALRQLPQSNDVSLLLGQFTKAENEFHLNLIDYKVFEAVKNRVLAAAMKMV